MNFLYLLLVYVLYCCFYQTVNPKHHYCSIMPSVLGLKINFCWTMLNAQGFYAHLNFFLVYFNSPHHNIYKLKQQNQKEWNFFLLQLGNLSFILHLSVNSCKKPEYLPALDVVQCLIKLRMPVIFQCSNKRSHLINRLSIYCIPFKHQAADLSNVPQERRAT